MQSLESITDSQFLQNPNNSSSASVNGLYGWLFECHGFWHNLFLIIPSLLFVLFLTFQAKKSFQKLSHGRSYIMISYYGCLWLVSLLNLAWCSLQVCGFFPSNLILKIWVFLELSYWWFKLCLDEIQFVFACFCEINDGYLLRL